MVESVPLGPLEEGRILVRNLLMSIDPYMRGRMNPGQSYIPPFQLGQPFEGAAVGEVVQSRTRDLIAGDLVISNFGWREYFVSHADEVQRMANRVQPLSADIETASGSWRTSVHDGAELHLTERPVQPLSAYLGVLGMTGLTAWVGLNLAEVKPGETVFISSAAGAVGSVAGQLARIRGCKVIGSAGSAAKVKLLTEELGFDAAFNHRDGDTSKQLSLAAPQGIDVYFDNVGGRQLEAALAALRQQGRIIACGAISLYNEQAPSPGPRNLAQIIGKRLTMKGFIVSDWLGQMQPFLFEMNEHLAAGKIVAKETIYEGIESAPLAFLNMLHGEVVGKTIVRIAD